MAFHHRTEGQNRHRAIPVQTAAYSSQQSGPNECHPGNRECRWDCLRSRGYVHRVLSSCAQKLTVSAHPDLLASRPARRDCHLFAARRQPLFAMRNHQNGPYPARYAAVNAAQAHLGKLEFSRNPNSLDAVLLGQRWALHPILDSQNDSAHFQAGATETRHLMNCGSAVGARVKDRMLTIPSMDDGDL